jgi:hypothetical protein
MTRRLSVNAALASRANIQNEERNAQSSETDLEEAEEPLPV